MTVPARNVRCAFAKHGLRFHDEIFQDFVERGSHVHVAVGERRAVMKDEELPIGARLLDSLVEPRFIPHFQQLWLARDQIRLHRKIRAREIERVFVILAHRGARTLTFTPSQINAMLATPSIHKGNAANELALAITLLGDISQKCNAPNFSSTGRLPSSRSRAPPIIPINSTKCVSEPRVWSSRCSLPLIWLSWRSIIRVTRKLPLRNTSSSPANRYRALTARQPVFRNRVSHRSRTLTSCRPALFTPASSTKMPSCIFADPITISRKRSSSVCLTALTLQRKSMSNITATKPRSVVSVSKGVMLSRIGARSR